MLKNCKKLMLTYYIFKKSKSALILEMYVFGEVY
jgi:hypothetical protein